ncbi:hypothetical protein [Sphingomonas sp. PP-CE-1G-424]|uniref:hypothetical protein n=1 Tax=Sphingomonas sp. PP-CE-1G-424 TaxID=2135658 RepID=UPI0010561CF1|nr:hypothetical protein [Sphingomonas sp. PP-CE-1G-424]TCP65843.1 hypothetical protein C8J43_10845 [Sphingomonas sp. PP-CE-1G-424]
MAKPDRLARLDAQREDLETQYRDTLIAALEKTASGSLGLFDRSPDRRVRAAIAPTIDALNDMGADIDAMRDRLMLEPFALHRDFFAARGPVSASAVGEQKEARLWIDRLNTADAAR